MKSILLGAGAALLAASLAAAQTPTPGGTGTQTATPGTSMGTSMGAPANPNGTNPNDKAAASGDTNQAVTTTSANADQPAKGKNSFTMKQARHRIEKKGYSNVTGLTKDQNGVWRGTAQKDGQSVNVWLDYKGNVGQSS